MILWLDDDINRSSLRNFVETVEEEFCVIRVENPKEALSVLEERSEQLTLFIIDIIMPTSNLFDRDRVKGGTSTGIEFLKLIKKDAKYDKLPIMFYSIRFDQEALSYAEDNGMPFVVKQRTPLSEFLAKVKSVVKK